MLGTYDTRARDYYCFCTTKDMAQFFSNQPILGNIYVFDVQISPFHYRFYRQIQLSLIADPNTPSTILTNNVLTFLIPHQYTSSFFIKASVNIRYNFSGDKIQIMDYERCPYPICRDLDDLFASDKLHCDSFKMG